MRKKIDIAKLPFWNNKKFNPKDLFKNGEQGVWYDPSDISRYMSNLGPEINTFSNITMFQDATGTTPVTGVEQPVGLILDKSRGTIRGPELLPNGDFSTTTNWSTPAGWVISGGVCTATTTVSSLKYSPVCTADRFYIVEFNWTHTAGTLYVRVGTGPAITFTTSGRKRVILMANDTNGFEAYGGAVSGMLDNVSVKEVYGNHAYQTTEIYRPILRQDLNGKYYLACNGTNTGMRTNNINFNTDKITGFISTRILSGTGTQQLLETSTNYASNNGAFQLSLNEINSGKLVPAYKAVVGTQYLTSTLNTVPRNTVTTFTFNTTLTTANGGITIREQGVSTVSSPVGTSTGTIFGNYPLYLFRRSGTSLPFNGNFYGLILRGAFTNNSQITKTEKYLTKKLG